MHDDEQDGFVGTEFDDMRSDERAALKIEWLMRQMRKMAIERLLEGI
jgi:hypothetical protein